MTKKAATKKGADEVIIALVRAAFRRRLKEAGFPPKEITLILRTRVEAETDAVYAWIQRPQKGGR